MRYSFHGIDCDEKTFLDWKRIFSAGSCPWCRRRLVAAFRNNHLHLRACKRRPVQCPDCGAPGERSGHMECQYPQDHGEGTN